MQYQDKVQKHTRPSLRCCFHKKEIHRHDVGVSGSMSPPALPQKRGKQAAGVLGREGGASWTLGCSASNTVSISSSPQS